MLLLQHPSVQYEVFLAWQHIVPNSSQTSVHDVSEPLRQMIKKNASFKWEQQHQQSFTSIKQLLTSADVMAYFDLSKKTDSLLMLCHLVYLQFRFKNNC